MELGPSVSGKGEANSPQKYSKSSQQNRNHTTSDLPPSKFTFIASSSRQTQLLDVQADCQAKNNKRGIDALLSQISAQPETRNQHQFIDHQPDARRLSFRNDEGELNRMDDGSSDNIFRSSPQEL